MPMQPYTLKKWLPLNPGRKLGLDPDQVRRRVACITVLCAAALGQPAEVEVHTAGCGVRADEVIWCDDATAEDLVRGGYIDALQAEPFMVAEQPALVESHLVEVAPASDLHEKIRQAVASLTDADFTSIGKPRVDAVSLLVGEDVTRQDINAALGC